MPTSQELRADREQFTRLIQGALGPLIRIRLDTEGRPYVPARYGRVEWRGTAPDGQMFLYAYTDRPRMIRPLLGLDGVRRVQVGDDEAVVAWPANVASTTRTVADLLRTRTRRAPETGRYQPQGSRPDTLDAPRSDPGGLD